MKLTVLLAIVACNPQESQKSESSLDSHTASYSQRFCHSPAKVGSGQINEMVISSETKQLVESSLTEYYPQLKSSENYRHVIYLAEQALDSFGEQGRPLVAKLLNEPLQAKKTLAEIGNTLLEIDKPIFSYLLSYATVIKHLDPQLFDNFIGELFTVDSQRIVQIISRITEELNLKAFLASSECQLGQQVNARHLLLKTSQFFEEYIVTALQEDYTEPVVKELSQLNNNFQI